MDEGSQEQFGVPSGNFVFVRFDALGMATYVTNNNFNPTKLSFRTGRKQVHRLNDCKGDSQYLVRVDMHPQSLVIVINLASLFQTISTFRNS
jgi:hypothetical protein